MPFSALTTLAESLAISFMPARSHMSWASYFWVSGLCRTTPAILCFMTFLATLGALLSFSAILGFVPRFAAGEALFSITAFPLSSFRSITPRSVGIVSDGHHMMPLFMSNLMTPPATLSSPFLPGSDIPILFTPICGLLRTDVPFMVAFYMAIGTSSRSLMLIPRLLSLRHNLIHSVDVVVR
jgi:hypothetical protein